MKTEQKIIRDVLFIDESTMVNWVNFRREHCMRITIKESKNKVGPGKIVEIYQSKFKKRKYNRGHRVEGQWVFGEIERDSKPVKMFVFLVQKRDRDTLIQTIKEWILPGTTIMSDSQKAYDSLGEEGYTHLKVNHSASFVVYETGAHTNLIESTWNAIKREMSKYGTVSELYTSYFLSIVWRKGDKKKID